MSTLRILESDARPQAASPLFTRLPAELRLLIYTFVFMGCQATVWFDCEFGAGNQETWEGRLGRPRKTHLKDGQCFYQHFGGRFRHRSGFGLLTTCRLVYIEAFGAYWAETALTVKRLSRPRHNGVKLEQVCAYLPAAIKANLGHLRNTRLPILGKIDENPKQGDPNWTPTLLGQFPKLKSCASYASGHLKGATSEMRNLLTVPDSDNGHRGYWGVGAFQVKGAESPAAFIERRIGVQQSCGITILSIARAATPPSCAQREWHRVSPNLWLCKPWCNLS